jgi:hypothetical protein
MKLIQNKFIYIGAIAMIAVGSFGYLAHAVGVYYGEDDPAPTDKLSLSPVSRTVTPYMQTAYSISLPADPSDLDFKCVRYYEQSTPSSLITGTYNGQDEYCAVRINPFNKPTISGGATIVSSGNTSVTVRAAQEGTYTLTVPAQVLSCMNTITNSCLSPVLRKEATLTATLVVKNVVPSTPETELVAETTFTVGNATSTNASSLSITTTQKDFALAPTASREQSTSTSIIVTPVNMKSWAVEDPEIAPNLVRYIHSTADNSLLNITLLKNELPAGTNSVTGDMTVSVRGVGNDNQNRSASAIVHVTLQKSTTPPGTPLACSLSASPSSGVAPLTTTLNITADGGKTPYAKYEFDWTGDGTYDYSASNPVSPKYTAPGIYTVRGRVTDAAGAQATCQQTLKVTSTVTPPGKSSFELTITNPSNKLNMISKTPGSAVFSVGVRRLNGFTAGIRLSVSGLPADMGAKFSVPNNILTNQTGATLTISAPAGKSGTFPFTVSGVGIGTGVSNSDQGTVLVGSITTISDCGCKLAAQRVPFSKDVYVRWNCTGERPQGLFVMGQEGGRSWLLNDGAIAWPTNGSAPALDKSVGTTKGPQGGAVTYGVYCSSDTRDLQ